MGRLFDLTACLVLIYWHWVEWLNFPSWVCIPWTVVSLCTAQATVNFCSNYTPRVWSSWAKETCCGFWELSINVNTLMDSHSFTNSCTTYVNVPRLYFYLCLYSVIKCTVNSWNTSNCKTSLEQIISKALHCIEFKGLVWLIVTKDENGCLHVYPNLSLMDYVYIYRY